MLKVLLVDDEPIIKAAFQKIIPWEEEGFQIAGSAGSGKEALLKLAQSPADIVITDLKMPQMDGIALIKELKSSGFDGLILVLSNYADFDLVREALVAGAMDYMLKVNIDANMLTEKLQKARETLFKQRKNDQREKLVKEHSALLRVHALRTYLTVEENELPDPPPQVLLDAYSNHHGAFGMCYIAFLPSSHSTAAHLPSPSHVESVLRAIFENVQDADLMVLGDRAILCVYPLLSLGPKGIRIEDKLDQVTRQISMYFNSQALLLTAPPAGTLTELRLGCKALLDAATLSFYALPAMAINVEAVRLGSIPEDYQAETLARRLAECFIYKEDGHITDHLAAFFGDCRIARASPADVKDFMIQTYRHLLAFAPHSQAVQNTQNAVAALQACRDELELMEQSLLLFTKVLMQIVPPAYAHCKEDARKALLFMHTNYFKHITLDDIARAANLDRSYLCRLFKKETGMNLFAYLNDLRLSAAAQIIAEEGVYIREVAGRVGIDDPFYFTRLFTRRFGVSPSEYRSTLE